MKDLRAAIPQCRAVKRNWWLMRTGNASRLIQLRLVTRLRFITYGAAIQIGTDHQSALTGSDFPVPTNFKRPKLLFFFRTREALFTILFSSSTKFFQKFTITALLNFSDSTTSYSLVLTRKEPQMADYRFTIDFPRIPPIRPLLMAIWICNWNIIHSFQLELECENLKWN